MKDLQDVYLNGKNAIIPNLPQVVAHTTKDGTHAYTKLSDVIANMLASHTRVDKFWFEAKVHNTQTSPNDYIPESTNGFTNSTTVAGFQLFLQLIPHQAPAQTTKMDNENKVLPRFVLVLWFKDWKDAFDPFNTKTSRNQVWTNTSTICPPLDEKNGRNTYFMAISNKDDDHSEVEKIFANELKVLSTEGMMAYHGGLKRIIHVKVGKITTCVDRPERTTIFRVGDHNSTFGAYWGYAVFVDGICKDNHLPSCPHCRKQ